MNTPLQSTSLTEEELTASDEAFIEEEEVHIHLPGPSLWPILLGVAILVVFVGIILFGTPNHNQLAPLAPWFVFIGLPCVLIGQR